MPCFLGATADVCSNMMELNKRTSFVSMSCYKTNSKCHSCTVLSYGYTLEVLLSIQEAKVTQGDSQV